jgi:hypothetical protein
MKIHQMILKFLGEHPDMKSYNYLSLKKYGMGTQNEKWIPYYDHGPICSQISSSSADKYYQSRMFGMFSVCTVF